MINEFDTIAAIATAVSNAGIGIIRISGPEALKAAGAIFQTKKYLKDPKKEWDQAYFEKKETHTIHYGMIVNEDGSMLDEVMVLLMKAPKSYTCEDVVEIDSHGGPFLVQKILKRILHQGVRLAEPGEFTKRAFLNGRIDLAQAEAVMKMISSKGEFALESATKQLEGRVSGYIEEIRQEILHNMGYIEAALDDPEHYELDGFSEKLHEMLQKECNRLQELLDNFENGRMKSEGINTVIVGKPNAGKSSLMNLLLDEERAIVTNIAGTTRDILEETVHIGNIVLNLVDTAGIHDTEDIVEHMGVEKAKEYLADESYLWNSGMFVWKISTILNNMKEFMPKTYEGLVKIQDAIGTEEQESVLEAEFEKMDSESIDYGIMEKAENIFVLPGTFGWDDVGSWLAVGRIRSTNEFGNAVQGNVITVETKNSIIEGSDKLIAAVKGDVENGLLFCGAKAYMADKIETVYRVGYRLKSDQK